MDFIRTYFGMKIAAVRRLLEIAQDAWDNKIWLGFVLVMLWTLFCTIGGILLLPIDIIVCGIAWCKSLFARDAMKNFTDEMNET